MKKKNKMQDVSFRNIDEFLEYLPDNELKIAQLLRKIIFSCAPEAIEKLNYNVPFYKVHKNFCFIWPASVLWGRTKTYEGVRLGFSCGYLMADEINYLDKGDRKQVYYRDYQSAKEIDTDLLKSYIFQALEIDEGFKTKGG